MSFYLSPALVAALGNMVLHSLWQASLLALFLWFFSRRSGASPLWRYRVGMASLLLQLLLGLATFYYAHTAASVVGLAAETSQEMDSSTAALVVREAMPASSAGVAPSLYWVLSYGWLLGLLLGSLRYTMGHAYLHYYYRRQLLRLPAAWETMAANLLEQLHFRGKHPRLWASPRLASPMLLGVVRPLLLFPLAIVNQLSPEQVEAVLAHELSHLARRDHWWNFFQQIVEVLFYFHPAVHWISKQVREEREHCCDDQVAQLGIDPLCYAKTLFQLEEQRQMAAHLALAARPAPLLNRMERLLRQTPNYYRMKPGFLIVLLLLVGALFAFRPADADTHDWAADQEEAPRRIFTTYTSDTLPDGQVKQLEIIRSSSNARKVEIQKENGKIVLLKVDGERIPEDRYSEYATLLESIKEAPAPPMPPSAPSPPSPPSPPAPPSAPAPPGLRGGAYQFFYDSQEEDLGDGQSKMSFHFKLDSDSLFNGLEIKRGELEEMKIDLRGLVESMRNWGEKMGESESFQFSFPGLEQLDGRRPEDSFFRMDSAFIFRLDREGIKTNTELEELLEGFEKRELGLRQEGRDAPSDLESFAWVKRLPEKSDKVPSSQKFLSLIKEFQRKALLPEGNIDKLDISDKKLKINGKKVSDDVFSGFKKAYEDRYRLRWEELGAFSIKVG